MKGMVSISMAYECRIYNKKGKLVKIVNGKKIDSKSDEILFKQPSTKKAISLIRRFKDPKKEITHNTKFYNKTCVVCAKEFHPRSPNAKYCSHECQKELQLKNQKRGLIKKIKYNND
jgi:predicted nucleic acid-binding Zn ribbon protein